MPNESPLDGIRSPFGPKRGGGPPAAFSPSSLYSSGSQGIWLDPSDLSTMFSDRAGTTPVTAPGTVVGLRLDKSKGLALGSELVGATSPSEIAANWTNNGGGSYTSNGTGYLRFTGLVTGKSYKVSFRVASYTSGSLLGFVDAPWDWNINAASQYATIRVASGGTVHFFGNSFVGSIDNISVKELPGNHAVAPTDAARPIYGVEPKGGRRNLLTWIEDFGNAVWAKVGLVAVTPDFTTDPLGGVTADRIVFSGSGVGSRVAQGVAALPGGTAITLSIWLRGAVGGEVMTLSDGWSTSSNLTLTTSWQRLTATLAANASSTTFMLFAQTGTPTVYAWGAQLELGSAATNYQRVTTAYDVTESGVQSCHYVQYDGSDDSMSTAAIDFTATDKMSVFAGVRKLSDALLWAVVGLGSNINNDLGSFEMANYDAGGSVTNFYCFRARGTLGGSTVAASGYTAPITNVLTGTADIVGDAVRLRVNGTQVAQSTADQGTGNYGNYPLFIGRRGNSTLPFNGRDFGIIVVGKAASAGEIADTETWLAARTAQVTL